MKKFYSFFVVLVLIILVGCKEEFRERVEIVPTPGEEEGVLPREGAITSIDFTVDMIRTAGTTTIRYRARNIGASDMDIRVDNPTFGYSIILKKGQSEGWSKYEPPLGENVWQSYSELDLDFDADWIDYSGIIETYVEELSDWTSGEVRGTDPMGMNPYRIYNLQMNPKLPDAVFQPS